MAACIFASCPNYSAGDCTGAITGASTCTDENAISATYGMQLVFPYVLHRSHLELKVLWLRIAGKKFSEIATILTLSEAQCDKLFHDAILALSKLEGGE